MNWILSRVRYLLAGYCDKNCPICNRRCNGGFKHEGVHWCEMSHHW